MTNVDCPQRIHVLAKPTVSTCNLNCDYCFYLKKESLYPGSRFRMSDEVLEAYLRQQVEWQDEQILYKGEKGHTSLADGVTLLAQSKPALFKTGARGSGWNPNPDHGQAPPVPPTTAAIYAARVATPGAK